MKRLKLAVEKKRTTGPYSDAARSRLWKTDCRSDKTTASKMKGTERFGEGSDRRHWAGESKSLRQGNSS
jgi:hypothetical protein